MRDQFPSKQVSYAILRVPFGPYARLKTVLILYIPSFKDTTDIDKALLVQQNKISSLFEGVHLKLNIEGDRSILTTDHVEEELRKVVHADTLILRVALATYPGSLEPASDGGLVTVYLAQDATVGDLQRALWEKFKIEPKQQRILKIVANLANSYGDAEVKAMVLDDATKKLTSAYGLVNGDKLYLEEKTTEIVIPRYTRQSSHGVHRLAQERISELERSILLPRSEARRNAVWHITKRKRDTTLDEEAKMVLAATTTIATPAFAPSSTTGTHPASTTSHATPSVLSVATAFATTTTTATSLPSLAATAASTTTSSTAVTTSTSSATTSATHSHLTTLAAINTLSAQVVGVAGTKSLDDSRRKGDQKERKGSGDEKRGWSDAEDDDDEHELWDIDPAEILIVKALIGRGKTASVHKGIWRLAEVAYKELTYARVTESVLRTFREEVSILTQLRHKNVVRLVGVCTNPKKLSIITEWVPRGALRDILLTKSIKFNLHDLLRMASDIANGMAYLHSTGKNGVIHRDLKSHNLLVDEEWTVKVADFGYSKVLGDSSDAFTSVGTSGWVAPEVLSASPEDGYKKSIDVFSYGVCVWEMLTRGASNPLSGLSPEYYRKKIEAKEMPPIPTWCPKEISNLIWRCWSYDPTKRPTFDEIVKILNGMLAPAKKSYYASINVPYSESDQVVDRPD